MKMAENHPLSIDYTGGVDLEMQAIKKLSPKKKGEKAGLLGETPSRSSLKKIRSRENVFATDKEKSAIKLNEVINSDTQKSDGTSSDVS